MKTLLCALLAAASLAQGSEALLEGKSKILVLGDSITQAGDYVTHFDAWLVKQRQQGWQVADLHSEMRATVDRTKQDDPKFTVQRDRVHPNAAGHWMMAQSLIRYFGDAKSAKLDSPDQLLGAERLQAVTQRMKLYQKAVHAETKPLRPGVPQGGTLESAAAAARDLEARIYPADP